MTYFAVPPLSICMSAAQDKIFSANSLAEAEKIATTHYYPVGEWHAVEAVTRPNIDGDLVYVRKSLEV